MVQIKVLQGCHRHVSWVLRIKEGFFRQRSGWGKERTSTRKGMEARAEVVRVHGRLTEVSVHDE